MAANITVNGVPLEVVLRAVESNEIQQHLQAEQSAFAKQRTHHHTSKQKFTGRRSGPPSPAFDVLLWHNLQLQHNVGRSFNAAAAACGLTRSEALDYVDHFVTRVTGVRPNYVPASRSRHRGRRPFGRSTWNKLARLLAGGLSFRAAAKASGISKHTARRLRNRYAKATGSDAR